MSSRPTLSLLSELLYEPDPVEEVKERVLSVSLIVWYIHRWQADEFEDLAEKFKHETNLTQDQRKRLGRINKSISEPELLRIVADTLDNPCVQGDEDGRAC